MPHIVTERCVDCRYTDCVTVCPSEAFYEVKNPAMLVIDPDTCADCAACVPECPVYAIYPEEEVPEPYKEWIQKNQELVSRGQIITSKIDPLPTAVPIDKIREREKQKGWTIPDPSEVGGKSASTGESKPEAAPALEKPAEQEAEAPAEPLPEVKAPEEAPAPAAAPAESPPQEIKEAATESAPPPQAEPAPEAVKKETAPAPPPAKEKKAPPAEKPAPAASAPPPEEEPPKPEKPEVKKPEPVVATSAAVPRKDLPPGYQAPPTQPQKQPQPPLEVRPGGRIRLGFRTGTVQMIRRGPRDFFTDMRIQFDGEEKPVWHVYSALQTFRERGDLEILDPGPKPGLLQKIFRR